MTRGPDVQGPDLPPREVPLFFIECVLGTGMGRAVIDLFRGAGRVQAGALICDLDGWYRVDLVLVHETTHGGTRVLTTRVSSVP